MDEQGDVCNKWYMIYACTLFPSVLNDSFKVSFVIGNKIGNQVTVGGNFMLVAAYAGQIW